MRKSRREFIAQTFKIASAGGLCATLPLPTWALQGASLGHDDVVRDIWDLTIGNTPIILGDRRATATGINGSVPGPLVRLREGQRVVLNVTNKLAESSSIHWHGLLLPTNMDGVPGLSFDGIRAGTTYRYEFDVRQNGTYWYHSHSDLQEQTGVYGPLIIDPADKDPVDFDREFVVLLSDWTFEDPHRVLANLKVGEDYYNLNRHAGQGVLDEWAQVRMSKTDIADVTGATYTYLMNGRNSDGNWTGLFKAGERIRLRFINGSAMSFYNVRIPGLTMTVVQADGQYVEPIDVDEFQIGTAETYDVVVMPGDGAYTIMAESMDRSGYVRGTLTTRPGLQADVPSLREPPQLTMMDMGMNHGEMADHARHMPKVEHNHRRGPGVANIAEMPMNRLNHPGIGLENVAHKTLRYADLKSTSRNKDPRNPGRTMELHLTGNMHRYMWSFDGIKFSEVKGPIEFDYGERLRMVLVNDTMMSHPIHLHGMYVELVTGNGAFNPRKHTVVLKPAERLMVDITADEPGLWAFHCHLLYHMKAGMMRAVRVAPGGNAA
ncbi:MAG: copper resistance system multicopper oxidase [Gammaproteobacteria bacterium]|nr:copper resistance system multicopper oxidase [Gammaproteobacteria bacterium]